MQKIIKVCLCFSLRKLQEKCDFLNREVEYLKYSELSGYNDYRIDENEVDRIGTEAYLEKYLENYYRVIFRKHEDYINESEYRFISFAEADYDYIEIENCITGIIVSNDYITDFKREQYIEICNKLNISLLFISWDCNGVSLVTDKEYIRKLENFKEILG